jgi:hypothetical protein
MQSAVLVEALDRTLVPILLADIWESITALMACSVKDSNSALTWTCLLLGCLLLAAEWLTSNPWCEQRGFTASMTHVWTKGMKYTSDVHLLQEVVATTPSKTENEWPNTEIIAKAYIVVVWSHRVLYPAVPSSSLAPQECMLSTQLTQPTPQN